MSNRAFSTVCFIFIIFCITTSCRETQEGDTYIYSNKDGNISHIDENGNITLIYPDDFILIVGGQSNVPVDPNIFEFQGRVILYRKVQTDLYEDWYPYTGECFNDFIELVKLNRHDGEIVGFFFYQGEADTVYEYKALAYESELAYLVKSVRDTLEIRDLPVVITKVSAHADLYLDIVREAQQTVAENDPLMEAVDTIDLATRDGVHYTDESQEILAARMMNALSELTK